MDHASSDIRLQLARALLSWFDRNRRVLPWRKDRDPYHIWVSEIMLQQTQVATVIPFYTRFLEAFPSIPALAAAELQDVLRLWEGLGYYRRARNLHAAAQRLVRESAGCIPNDPSLMRGLPGIGRYTLGAILSQAYDARLPVVEANSQRVLSRLFGWRDDPRGGPARRRLWQTAEALLPKRRVGDFNQALMELGALVCTPLAPRCPACPVARHCAARRLGVQEEIPARAARPETVRHEEVAVIVRRGTRVLLLQRPDEGRWASLWEFPHGAEEAGETHERAAVRLAQQLAGIAVKMGPELLTLRHSVTHHRITLVCFEADYRSGRFQSSFYRAGNWLEPGQLAAYPVSAPQRRLAQKLISPDRQQRLF
jgi:A/G-specific adenine glycosylase